MKHVLRKNGADRTVDCIDMLPFVDVVEHRVFSSTQTMTEVEADFGKFVKGIFECLALGPAGIPAVFEAAYGKMLTVSDEISFDFVAQRQPLIVVSKVVSSSAMQKVGMGKFFKGKVQKNSFVCFALKVFIKPQSLLVKCGYDPEVRKFLGLTKKNKNNFATNFCELARVRSESSPLRTPRLLGHVSSNSQSIELGLFADIDNTP